MSRIVFETPDQFSFCTDFALLVGHINMGGHLDNAELIGLLTEARCRFFDALEFPAADAGKVSIVVGDVLVQYKTEAFHREIMRVELVPADLGNYGFDLVFRMTEAKTGREIACGKLGMVCIDKVARKVIVTPESIRARLMASMAARRQKWPRKFEQRD